MHAIATRPDGDTFRETRVKMAAVIVAEKVHAPPAKIIPIFLSFIAYQSQPVDVKPDMIGMLVRMTALTPDSARVIGVLLSQIADPSVRIATLNAIASKPRADPVQTDLIIPGLRDSNADVRNAAIHILKRL